MKKFISVILTVVMILSVFSVMTFAEEDTQDTCEHTTLSGQCSNCNAFIIEEGATLSLSIVITGYYSNPEWKLTENNATVTASGSDVLIGFGGVAYQTKEWVEIKGVTVGTDILKLYTSGSVYTSAEIVVVPHQTHIPKTIKGTATCTSPGLSDGEVCEYCGIVITEQTEVDALGHQEEVIKGYSATCTTTGLTDGMKCSLCDKILTAQEEIPTTDHNYYMIGGEPASCTVAGFQEYWCIDCGSTYIVTEEPTGHNYYENNFWPATCTEPGYIEYMCWGNCSDLYSETIEPIGHTYDSGKVTTKATCSSTGVKTHTCSVCNATKTEPIAKDSINHAGGATIKNATTATCTSKGYTGDTYCNDCSVLITKGEEVPSTGHTKTTVKGYVATCTKAGLTDGVKCSVCDEILTAQKTIKATGHTKTTVKGYAATCTKAGLTDGEKCSVCNEILTAQKEIPALSHTFGEWAVVIVPTTSSEGVEERTCTACGEKETRTVEKFNFIMGDINGDGKVTTADARLVLRIAVGLESLESYPVPLEAIDMDGNGKLATSDARTVLRKAVGLE